MILFLSVQHFDFPSWNQHPEGKKGSREGIREEEREERFSRGESREGIASMKASGMPAGRILKLGWCFSIVLKWG